MVPPVTGRVARALEAGKMYAQVLGHVEVRPGHILAAMLEDSDSPATKVLVAQQGSCKGDVSRLRTILRSLLLDEPVAETSEEPVEGASTKETMKMAEEFRRESG